MEGEKVGVDSPASEEHTSFFWLNPFVGSNLGSKRLIEEGLRKKKSNSKKEKQQQ